MGQVCWKHLRTQGCTHGNSGCTLLATGATWGRGVWAMSQDLVLKKKTWEISLGDRYNVEKLLSLRIF